jgi:hypothetical protein
MTGHVLVEQEVLWLATLPLRRQGARGRCAGLSQGLYAVSLSLRRLLPLLHLGDIVLHSGLHQI